jgi:hypothetical protein
MGLLFLAASISALQASIPINPFEAYVRDVVKKMSAEALTTTDVKAALAVETTLSSIQRLPRDRAALHHRNVRHLLASNFSAFPVLTAQPEQIHIAIAATSSNVTVNWITSNQSSGSRVCYHVKLSDVVVCQDGSTWTYDPISIVPWVGNCHGANMIDLTPGAEYCYRVGDAALNVWSREICFTAPNLQKDEITVALGGDMGSIQLFGYLVAEQMRADEVEHRIQFDAFWLLGDIAYSTLDPGNAANAEFFWDIYMRQEQSFVDHVPFLVTYGNHDFNGGDSAAFINRFRMPTQGGGLGNFYWAYKHGPVFFVSMCTEVALLPITCNFAPGSPQYVWLEQQFASINRTETPWLILGGHRPMYSTDTSTDSGPLQQYIEPLLRKYSVDVQMTGHMHDTELVAPVYANVPSMEGVARVSENKWIFSRPRAPVHMTVGTLGGLQEESYVQPQPAWSLYRNGTIFDDAYGYVRMVANRSALHFVCLKQRDNSTMWELIVQK